jgi:hypothetical protein
VPLPPLTGNGELPIGVHLRKAETNPVNYHLSVSGFLAEIDRMQLGVLEYLSLHPGELKASA